MFFSELYKITVEKVTFVGFRGAIAPWVRPCSPLQFLFLLRRWRPNISCHERKSGE